MKIQLRIFLLIILLFILRGGTVNDVLAQNIGINTTGAVPNASALFDIDAAPGNSKGLLIPRLTTAQMNAIASPADGLIIYNTDCKSFNYYNGNTWIAIGNTGSVTTPGAITGSATPCQNATGVSYSITAVSGATGYNWTVPTGASVATGQGSTSVTVNFATTNGNVCVTASNACGTSNASCTAITLSVVPAQPSVITGTTPVCQNQSGVAYSVTNVPGVTYSWTFSGTGFTCVTGCTTNSITADFSSSATSGTLSCTPSNACGSGTAQTFSITVNTSVSAPTATAATNIASTSFSSNWSSSTGATTYYLDVDDNSDFSSPLAGYNNLNVGNVITYSVTGLTCGITYYYRVRASNSCGTSSNSNSISTVTSAGGTLAFSKTFGGTGNDYGMSVIQTSDGGYAIIGYTDSYGAGGNDILVIKTDASGVQQWTKTFGGVSNDDGNDIKQTSDGGYILIGTTGSFGLGGDDSYVIKLDASGTIVWQKTYGTGSNERGYSIIQTTDGGYAFSGYTNNQTAWGHSWIIKTDAAGTVTWSKILAASSGAYTIIQTTDGGYLLGGNQAWGFGGGWYDSYIEKLDASGNSQWIKGSSDGTDDGEIGWAIQTIDGGYLWSGFTSPGAQGSYDGYVMKFDATGVLQWMKSTGTTGYDPMGFSVIQLSSGDYVSAGYTTDGGMAGNNICIYKNDVNGNYLANNVYGGAGSDTPGSFNSLKSTSDGGLILIGNTNSFGAGGVDFYLIKTDGLFTGSCSAALASGAVTKTLVNGSDNGTALSSGTSTTTVNNQTPTMNGYCGACQ